MAEKRLFIIKKSNISGKGVFAFRDLGKNLNLGLAFERINNTGNPDKDYRRTKLGAFVNHSSDGNLTLKQIDNKIFYFTKRKVGEGEELLLDYNLFSWEGKKDFTKNK